MRHSPALLTDVLYRFGEFVADPVIGRLHHRAEEIPLTRKTFEVLMALVLHEGHLVEKEDLFRQVWPDTIVEDNNLARCVSMLRKALRDRDPVRDYVVTVAGRGYQFGAPVERIQRGDLNGWLESHAKHSASETALPSVNDQSSCDPTALKSIDPSLSGAESISLVDVKRGMRRPLSRQTLASVGVIGLVVAAVTSGAISPGAAFDPDKRLWQFTSMSGLEVQPAWSPDGRFIAYGSNRSGNFDIWVQSVLGGNPIQITSADAAESQPAWSPDGRSVAFRSEAEGGGLFLVPAFGGAARRLTEFGQQPMWSPDGSKLLFYLSRRTMKNRAFVGTLDGAPPREILAGELEDLDSFRLAWHPDGRRVSVLASRTEDEWKFFTAALDSGSRVESTISRSVGERFSRLGLQPGPFVWAPDGGAILFEGTSQQAQNIYRVSVHPKTLEWIDGPTALTTSTNKLTDIALAPDGRRLAFSSRMVRTRAWSFPLDREGRSVVGAGEPITPEGTDTIRFDVSSDAEQLAYWTERNGQHELWIRALRDKQEKLEAVEQEAVAVRWSQDGKEVAYTRRTGTRDGSPAVVVVSLTGHREYAVRGVASVTVVDWLSPHSWLFGCPSGSRTAICSMDLAADPSSQLKLIASDSARSLFGGRRSPDGRWITFTARADASRSGVYLMPARGGSWIQLSQGHSYVDKARWSGDGSIVYFMSDRLGTLNVWGQRIDRDTGRPVAASFQVTKLDTPDRVIPDRLKGLQMAVTRERLMLPVSNVSGAVWVLDNLGQ